MPNYKCHDFYNQKNWIIALGIRELYLLNETDFWSIFIKILWEFLKKKFIQKTRKCQGMLSIMMNLFLPVEYFRVEKVILIWRSSTEKRFRTGTCFLTLAEHICADISKHDLRYFLFFSTYSVCIYFVFSADVESGRKLNLRHGTIMLDWCRRQITNWC